MFLGRLIVQGLSHNLAWLTDRCDRFLRKEWLSVKQSAYPRNNSLFLRKITEIRRWYMTDRQERTQAPQTEAVMQNSLAATTRVPANRAWSVTANTSDEKIIECIA